MSQPNHRDTETQRNLNRSLNDLTGQIIDAAYQVHSTLGPGLLESVYETCLCYELDKRGIPFQKQVSLPVIYDNITLEAGLRLDILVNKKVIVELKAVEKLTNVHQAQLLTYLKLTNSRLGLLINFNTARIKDGIKRVIL